MAEGETTRGVLLFADDPTLRASLYFGDASKLTGLATVTVDDGGSAWHFANSVRIGMSLAELVAVNGRPLRYYGLSWDYGGFVSDWNGGNLQQPAAGAFRGVRLAPTPAAKDTDYPQGDSEYSSDDPRWPKAGQALQVEQLALSFPDRSGR